MEPGNDNPEAVFPVVIVLAEGAEGVAPESLGIVDYASIPFQRGMIRASLTGADLVKLAELPEVEWIGPDEDATIL